MMNEFDIIIMAGQSNAQGTGTGTAEQEYVPTEHIMMLTDEANHRFETGDDGIARLALEYPSPIHIEAAQETVVDGKMRGQLQLTFAKMYYEKYLQGTDRKVLIIQSGVGGTGFCRNEWGTEGAILFDRLVWMTQYALDLNPDNRLVAFLWHQGECDTFENADWPPEKRYTTHKRNLSELFEHFCQRFDCPSLPIISASFCNEWYLKNKESADAVLAAIQEVVCARNGEFLDASNLKSNNEQNGDGDDIHFSRDALARLGKMYFQAYERIRHIDA